MHRGVYFDAWFPRQHCYHPSLPPRRLRMVDDLVDYRATDAGLGGDGRRLAVAAVPRAGGVRRRSTPRFRFYGFVNDSEFIAECHEHGIKVFGIVFEAQGWEFPVELNDAEDDGARAQRAARRRRTADWLGLREFSAEPLPEAVEAARARTSPAGSSTATASRSPT